MSLMYYVYQLDIKNNLPILLTELTRFTVARFYFYDSILCMSTQFGLSAAQLKYQSEREME